MVHINKPAHTREGAFTDKTGGCNSKADIVERIVAQAPKSSDEGNASNKRVTGGADLTMNQSVNWYEKG